MRHFFKLLNNFFFYFLRNPFILYLVGIIRFYFFVNFYGVKTIKSNENITDSNEHNLEIFDKNKIGLDFLMLRFDRLLYSVLANERFDKNSNILVIGNRTEADLLKIRSYGYKKITAIDLISYSPLVTLMDAHNMTFVENTFDVIFLPYVLPYSKNPSLLAKNIIKVSKPGSIVAVAIAYDEKQKIKSVEDIKNIFAPFINNINFIYDGELKLYENFLPNNNSAIKNKEYLKLRDVTGLDASSIILTFAIKK